MWTHMTRCPGEVYFGHPHSLPFIIHCECGWDQGSLFCQWQHTDEPSRFKADECVVQLSSTVTALQSKERLNFGINRRSNFGQCVQDLRLFFTVDIPLCYRTKFHLKNGDFILSAQVFIVSQTAIYRTIILLVFCMGVKLGRSHWGRNVGWGCWDEHLGLRGTRWQGSGVNYIKRSLMIPYPSPNIFRVIK